MIDETSWFLKNDCRKLSQHDEKGRMAGWSDKLTSWPNPQSFISSKPVIEKLFFADDCTLFLLTAYRAEVLCCRDYWKSLDQRPPIKNTEKLETHDITHSVIIIIKLSDSSRPWEAQAVIDNGWINYSLFLSGTPANYLKDPTSNIEQ